MHARAKPMKKIYNINTRQNARERERDDGGFFFTILWSQSYNQTILVFPYQHTERVCVLQISAIIVTNCTFI